MKLNLLVVDDNEMMRSFLSHFLKKHFRVKAVGNVNSAWNYLDKGYVPDVILLDILLPAQNGLDFLNQLKGSVLFNEIPVIILSGMDKSSKRVECLIAGADDYVAKPFNPKELELRIHKQLKHQAVLS